MTTLIKQKSTSDCVLAAIAMAAGKEYWEDLWTEEDLKAVEGGVGDEEPWMNRAGFKRKEHYTRVYTYQESGLAKDLLWKRRAMVSVASLNRENGYHMIYWDGEKIFDPSYELTFKHLSTCEVKSVILFNDIPKDETERT